MRAEVIPEFEATERDQGADVDGDSETRPRALSSSPLTEEELLARGP